MDLCSPHPLSSSCLISPPLSVFFTSPFSFPLSRVIVWHWHKLCAFLSNFKSRLGFLPRLHFALFRKPLSGFSWMQLFYINGKAGGEAWTGCSIESSVITLIIVPQLLSLSYPEPRAFFFLGTSSPLCIMGFVFCSGLFITEPIYFWSMSTFTLKFFDIFIKFVVRDSLGISTSAVNFLKVI